MKLAVLGATGPSGQLVVQQALDKGHDVVAIVRNPDKMTIKHDRLQVQKGDIFSADDLAGRFNSCNAVVSCLGTAYSFFRPITIYSESSKSIVEAMRKANVQRFVCMTTWYTDDRARSDHPWVSRLIVKPILRQFLYDMGRMENFLQKDCQDIDFTSVRPPGLNDNPMDGGDMVMEPDVDHSMSTKIAVPRADVAKCLLKIVEDNLYPKKCVAVGLAK